jgi:uncharacterized protein (TIGR03437 family)
VAYPNQFPPSLGGTQFLFNGTAAPLLWASAEQANAAYRSELPAPRASAVEVRFSGATSNVVQYPAPLGSKVSIFVNGTGAETHPADCTLAAFSPRPQLPVSARATAQCGYFADWQKCELIYAGAAPGELAGLLQVSFRLSSARAVFDGETNIPVRVGNLAAISAVAATSQ